MIFLDARFVGLDDEISGTVLRYNSHDVVRVYSYDDVDKIVRNVKYLNPDIDVFFYYDNPDDFEEEAEQE